MGHQAVELEKGATDTKLWKEVKRKRVRIPDLVCTRCGLRVECRAKTAPELSMSHSFTEESRAWDFGMVDTDCVALPVCEAVDKEQWSSGKLGLDTSYWHERNWVRWLVKGKANYFPVAAFRATPHAKTGTKGVEEGSETTISWSATFSSRAGIVEAADSQKVTIRRTTDGHRYTWRISPAQRVVVASGESVELNQLIAAAVTPYATAELACPGALPNSHIEHLLASRERTLRFTGAKLARLLNMAECCDAVGELVADADEDVYVRLEGVVYLAAVCGYSVRSLVEPYLSNPDEQVQLEGVISLAETATAEAVALLSEILDAPDRPFFLRSAAAWSLGRIPRDESINRLIRAFADISPSLRAEALDGMISIGGPAIPVLLAGLRNSSNDIAAGCAEALRQVQPLPDEALAELVGDLQQPEPSPWTVWLAGNLPRDYIAHSISELQQSRPHLHYAISLLWSFVDSWIARRWELAPGPSLPRQPEVNDAV